MEKLRTKSRNFVLIKAGFLFFFPLFASGVTVIFFNLGSGHSFFTAGEKEYRAKYWVDKLYPGISSELVEVSAQKDTAKVTSGDTVLWEGKTREGGIYKEQGGTEPLLTLFWIPTRFMGIPLFQKRWERRISKSKFVDLRGFLGEPGEICFAGVAAKNKGILFSGLEIAGGGGMVASLFRSPLKNPALRVQKAPKETAFWVKNLYFLNHDGAFLGRAVYDASSGLLLEAISFAKNGLSLRLVSTNYPMNLFLRVLLPFLLASAVLLGLYEMISSTRVEAKSGRIPVRVEFAILGYTAILVDFYLDGFYAVPAGFWLLLGCHLAIALLFWFRLGWWSLLALVEIGCGLITWLFFDDFVTIIKYFPASLSAWLLCMVVQKQVSPIKELKLPEFDRLFRYRRTF